MSPRQVVLSLVVVVALFGLGTAAHAGEFFSHSTFGSNFFSSSPPCPIRDFPTFEAIAPVPAIIDPFEEDLIPFFCQVQVSKNGKGVNKAKGTYTSQVVVMDHNTGKAETFFVDSGKFKTNSNGSDSFDFELPAELFADGFESGDVSAWSSTEVDFTSKKKADSAAIQCGRSSSRSE